MDPVLVKTCGTCGQTKPLDEFYVSEGRPRGSCKPCVIAKNRERYLRDTEDPARIAARRATKVRADLRYRYDLTEKERVALEVQQAGCCRICQQERQLQVDHDHSTGVVRGLLCGRCNKALGLLDDKVDVLLAAVRYLEESRVPV